MSQPTSDKQIEAREKERIQHERARWWELEESARRCIAISAQLWDDRIAIAMKEQQALATTMRDRTAPGVRATGKEYEMDRSVPTPLFTPRDRLQFLKEFATTLLISARQQQLPVTAEAMRGPPVGEPAPAGNGAAALSDVPQALAQPEPPLPWETRP